MGRLIVGLVASAVLLGTFLLSLPRGQAQGNAPEWSVGDRWDYKGQIPGGGLTMFLNLEVREKLPIVVGGISYATYHCNMTLTYSLDGLSLSSTDDIYFTVSNLGEVKTQFRIESSRFTKTYDPPLENFRFPLVGGQTWTSTSLENKTTLSGESTNRTLVFQYSVSNPRTISVPAGQFETVLITKANESGIVGMMYYSDKVGFAVTMGGMVVGFSRLDQMDLTSYNYQNAVSKGMSAAAILLVIVVNAVAIAALLIVLGWRFRGKAHSDRLEESPKSESGSPPKR